MYDVYIYICMYLCMYTCVNVCVYTCAYSSSFSCAFIDLSMSVQAWSTTPVAPFPTASRISLTDHWHLPG